MIDISKNQKSRTYLDVLADLDGFGKDDPNYKDGKTWSLVYYLNKEYNEFLSDAYEKYFSANGLNPTAFKSLKRFETDILKFTAGLFHIDDNACGVITSGGTESCLLAVKTYRDRARARGIRRPEMIIPETAHVAWDKGSEYFSVKIRRAPLNDKYQVDVKAVERMINRNTIMILGSAPEYPHGIIDPIEELGKLAMKFKIPLHVDACVGGYILPFMEMAGIELPLWDFRIPGVSSISADIHKYGFAAKGASCILYRNIDSFRYQCFVNQDWPGGVFASPALLGTRPGGAYAAAWAAIQANGIEGYIKLARRTIDAATRMKKGIAEIKELELIGKPKASLLSFRSIDPSVNIFVVGDSMEERGWLVDRLQRPDALHAMVTAPHDRIVDKYIDDLKDSVEEAKAHPERADQGQAATYGMISHIPLRGMVKKQVLDMFSKSYILSAKEIDLSASNSLAETNEEEKGRGSFLDKVIKWYVKKSSAKK